MLRIRPEQALALEEGWRASFHARLARLYRESLPDVTAPLDEPSLLSRIAEADAAALRFGIRTERGIGQFVGVSLVLGPHFHEHPRFRDYMTGDAMDRDRKMDRLMECLAELDLQAQDKARRGASS